LKENNRWKISNGFCVSILYILGFTHW